MKTFITFLTCFTLGILFWWSLLTGRLLTPVGIVIAFLILIPYLMFM